MEPNNNAPAKLWTKNFTIITLGSVVSMLGNSLSGFAMGLLVLDYTGSTLFYALYMAIYMLPRVVMPVLSGPFLDRFSRRKTIYMLDFISAGLYLTLAGLLHFGSFSFVLFGAFTFLIGTIDSVYQVAYESFYPMLVSEGNYSKAYSVSSTLETLTMLMIPVSAFVYNSIGIVPLFLVNSVSYLLAAIMETRIKAEEKYASDAAPAGGIFRRFRSDFKEGMRYLIGEKGLLLILLYFTVGAFGDGASSVITLPYFRSNFENGEYIFMLVWGMSVVGRAIGGGILYRLRLAQRLRYAFALCIYIIVQIIGGTYLYLSVPLMMVLCFITGIAGVTSYNIRISSTQTYVPDERKGRFNGMFAMASTVGMLVGELAAGALSTALGEREVLLVCMSVCALAAIVFIGGGKKYVAPIYNMPLDMPLDKAADTADAANKEG